MLGDSLSQSDHAVLRQATSSAFLFLFEDPEESEDEDEDEELFLAPRDLLTAQL